jgi:hypothetical protein
MLDSLGHVCVFRTTGCLDANVSTGVHGILMVAISRLGTAVAPKLKRLVLLLSTFADEGTKLYFKYASYCCDLQRTKLLQCQYIFPSILWERTMPWRASGLGRGWLSAPHGSLHLT